MARKLTDIANQIHRSGDSFFCYLQENLSKECVEFLQGLSKDHALYLFSGIIRDFFLRGKGEIRDVDLVFDGDEKTMEGLLKNQNYRKNSFNGYKIRVGEEVVDLWHIQKTWALNYGQTVLDLDLHTYIPHTAFFNFSAIIFDYKAKQFHFSVPFERFLRDKCLDIVYLPNPNQALCVVNVFYYSGKYRLRLSPRLQRFVEQAYPRHIGRYEAVQRQHFGKVLYGEEELAAAVRTMRG